MTRDIEQLTRRTFDLLVVGGGIYGLTIACDAAQRGLAVALIERRDFGSGASFNHLRTIHGGLRYLQSLDIRRARESIRERRALARIAAHAVQPLPFALPLSRSIARGTPAMRAGFLLDRLIAFDRNDDVPASHELPAGRVLTPRQAVERFPLLNGTRMTGAAVWYDYVTTEPDRLTLSWALSAAGHGAVLANYVEAADLMLDSRRAVGARAVDVVTGRRLEIGARVTINATGAAIDRLLAPAGLATKVPMLKAMNLVTSRAGGNAAVGGTSGAGRNLFMVPWRGRAIFGTWESPSTCSTADASVDPQQVHSFIADVNRAFPGPPLQPDEVTLVHRGIVPAVVRADGSVALEGHERVREHRLDGIEGLTSVAGTKYTTARAVAERIVDAVLADLRRPAVPSRSAVTPLPWSNATGDELLAHAARAEMVVTLADAVIRRTPLGALGDPGDSALRHAAAVVGDVLGWNDRRRDEEIHAVKRFYDHRQVRI